MLADKKAWNYYVIGIFFLYMAWLVYNVSLITPMADDWRCAAAPYHNDGTWYRVLPFTIGNPFWRPFEGFLAYFLGEYPFLFPYLNQAIVTIGHSILVILLYICLEKYTQNRKGTLIGAAIFALSPATVGTTSQIDGINQCWTLLCGVISSLFFIKGNYNNDLKYIVLFLIMAMVATLFKENGICWFFAPVFLCMINDYANGKGNFIDIIRQYSGKIMLGFGGSIAYFVARFALQGSISLGGSGRYAVHPSIIDIIKNNIIILGSSFTTVDSLALFLKPRSWIIVAITGIITLCFWRYLLKAAIELKKDNNWLALVLPLLVVAFINMPLTVMPHVSEMSAYQSVFAFAFLVGVLWKYMPINKWSKLSLAILLICMLAVSTHKFVVMQAYAESVKIGKQQYQEYFVNIPEKVLIFYVVDVPLEYSTYMQPLGHGLEQGRAFRSEWNWLDVDKNAKIIYCKSADEIKRDLNGFEEYDTIFIQYQSGKVEVLRN